MLTESWAGGGGIPPPAADLPRPALGDESTPGILRSSIRPQRVGLDGVTVDQVWRVRNVAVVMSAHHAAFLDENDVLQLARNLSARVVR